MKIYDNTKDDLAPVRSNREGECVTVFFTPIKTGEIRNFRCFNCGRLLFQYESEIGLVVDSADSPKEKGPIHYQCPRCKLMIRALW